MSRFDPKPTEKITLDAKIYEVMPHPAVQDMAFGQEGRKAVVYQLRSNGDLFALKIFKPKFQDASLVNTCQALSRLALTGLEVCTRICFTRSLAASLLNRYPEMEYAVLMPWVQGSTWFDIVVSRMELKEAASKQIAKNAADVLAELEARGFSHCDIAGSNVIVNMVTGVVNLIDVEDMCGPGLPPPKGMPQGTEGYQHRVSQTTDHGQWCAEGDRFAGAVLLAEMLAWHSPDIRRASDEEHYFAEEELQDPTCSRYRLMLDTLGGLSKQVADCFARAWESTTLAECPPLSEWATLLEFPLVREWLPVVAPPPPPPYVPDRIPIEKPPIRKWEIGFEPLIIPEPSGQPPDSPKFCWVNWSADGSNRVLQWLAVDGTDGYIVETSEQKEFTTATQVYKGTDTIWIDPDGSENVKYYRVCSFNAHGTSGWSDPVDA